jgi:fluoride exporter
MEPWRKAMPSEPPAFEGLMAPFAKSKPRERSSVMPTRAMPNLHRGEVGAIFLGGAAGGLLRVWLSRSFASGATDWPWAIFAINVSGSFTLACIATWFRERPPESRFHHPLWTIGFCGTYTTFSTMQLEILVLLNHNRYGLAAGYTLVSVLAGYLAIWIGTTLVRRERASA